MTVTRLLAALSVFVGLVLVACKPTEEKEVRSKPRVAVILQALASETSAAMVVAVEEHHAAHTADYDLTLTGIRHETDLAEQVMLVERALQDGAQIIVIAPADPKALIPALKRATDQGALVITIDQRLDADALQQAGLTVAHVGPDEHAASKQAGLAVAKELRSGDAVAIIEGLPAAFVSRQRRSGFQDAMKQAGAKVVSIQAGDWDKEKSRVVASSMLSEHPHLVAILCVSDTMALGAADAIQSAGKIGQVGVAGFGNLPAIRPLVEDGRVLATVDLRTEQLAMFGIKAALRIFSDHTPLEDQPTSVEVISSKQQRP